VANAGHPELAGARSHHFALSGSPFEKSRLLAVLSFLSGWMAIAYHFAFFTTILSRSPPVSVTKRSFPRYVQEARSGCVG
jgi:hypothetical protein